MFNGLGESFLEDSFRQSGKDGRVGDHQRGLVEGADQIFAQRTVYACLASDGAVHLGDDRGRQLDHGDTPVVDGGHESGQITHNAATERKHSTLSIKAELDHSIAEIGNKRHRLRGFTSGDC